jgi:hypothetical protein
LFIRKGIITLLYHQELEPARCPAGNRRQDDDTAVIIIRNPQDSNPQFRKIPNSQFGEFRQIPNSQFGEFPEFSKIPNSQFENLRDTQFGIHEIPNCRNRAQQSTQAVRKQPNPSMPSQHN